MQDTPGAMTGLRLGFEAQIYLYLARQQEHRCRKAGREGWREEPPTSTNAKPRDALVSLSVTRSSPVTPAQYDEHVGVMMHG